MKKWIFGFLIVLISGALIWSKGQESDCFVIPFELNQSNIPTVSIEIEGKKSPAIIDLGSCSPLQLKPEVLNNLSKLRYGNGKWVNIKGTVSIAPRYKIKRVSLGKLSFSPVFVTESQNEHEELLWTGSLDSLTDEKQGVIGRPLLTQKNFLLDAKNQKLIFSSSFKTLAQLGYSMDNFVEAPLEVTSNGVFIFIDTDLGNKRFFIDTGCTLSMCETCYTSQPLEKGFPKAVSEQFDIQGTAFGPMKLFGLRFPEKMGYIEAILGMDFFQNHTAYFDFEHSKIYLEKKSAEPR